MNGEIRVNEPRAFKLVKELCVNYHYSKTAPPSKFYFTIYEDNELVGCLTYGSGANVNGAKQFNLTHKEALELTRVCFIKHKNYISFYESKINKILKKNNIKLVYSYSDLRQQHTGSLYKSCNFKFKGEKKLNGIEIGSEEKQGREHQRNYGKKFKKQDLKGNDFIAKEGYKTRKQSNKYLGVKEL